MSAEAIPTNAVIIERPVYLPPVPADAYDVVVQTMTVLGGDGYPVGLQPIPTADVLHYDQTAKRPRHNSSHRAAQLAVYDEWLEPIADQQFSRFVVSGPAFPGEIDNDLAWHPALHLNRAVSEGDPHAVRMYEAALAGGKKSGLEGKIDLQQLLVGCFATAMERRMFAGVGEPEPLVTRSDMRAFKELDGKVPQIGVGILQALVSDYYAHVEQLSPSMRKYRQEIATGRE